MVMAFIASAISVSIPVNESSGKNVARLPHNTRKFALDLKKPFLKSSISDRDWGAKGF